MKTINPTTKPYFAILSADLTRSEDGWYQLLPAGHFCARDGRPFDVEGGEWFIDAAIAARFIAATAAIGQPVLFDYNHVTLRQEEDATAAKEAIAAAWLKDPSRNMQWREGLGLFVRLALTPAAQTAVDNGEWAYLSAVFPYDEKGHPLYLRMGALTNDPGLTGMQSIAALSAQSLIDNLLSHEEFSVMNEWLRQLLERLGIALPETFESASDDELSALFTQALEAIDTLKAAAEVAVDALEEVNTEPDLETLGEGLTDILDESATDIQEAEAILEEAALHGVDLTKFVPAKAYQLLAKRAAVLSARSQGQGAESIILAARRAGRVTAAEVPYLRTLARQKGVAVLKASLRGRVGIAALSNRQTTGLKNPARLAVLTAAEKEAARLTGMSEADYTAIKRKQRSR